MSVDVVQLLADYGLWAIAIATFTSCLAAPVPSTFLMLAGGAFAASGDMSLTAICTVAYIGALCGDQVGYFVGRRGGSGLVARLRARPKIGRSVGRAQDAVARWGAVAVFLSRWLVAPLGPYANLIAGAGGLAWAKFSLASLCGEVIWVGMYVALGYFFAAEIAEIAELTREFGGLAAAGVVAAFLGWLLFRRRAAGRAQRAAGGPGGAAAGPEEAPDWEASDDWEYDVPPRAEEAGESREDAETGAAEDEKTPRRAAAE